MQRIEIMNKVPPPSPINDTSSSGRQHGTKKQNKIKSKSSNDKSRNDKSNNNKTNALDQWYQQNIQKRIKDLTHARSEVSTKTPTAAKAKAT